MIQAVLTEFVTTALFLYLCTGAICFGTHLTDVSDSTGTGGETGKQLFHDHNSSDCSIRNSFSCLSL